MWQLLTTALGGWILSLLSCSRPKTNGDKDEFSIPVYVDRGPDGPATNIDAGQFDFEDADRVNRDELFTSIAAEEWNETTVRRVLHAFAFGGFASDPQIVAWSTMPPEQAIQEILSFDPHNVLLSPPEKRDNLHQISGTLLSLSDFWTSAAADNRMLSRFRDDLIRTKWGAPPFLWVNAVGKRGLNPVRQKITFWETNYHMATNQNASVFPHPILAYYDAVGNALESLAPYQQVIAEAAISAAVAQQFGHVRNVFRNGQFRGNEDFGREFHQLYFGILGDYNHDYHELTTIRNTAKALTGIRAPWNEETESPEPVATYDSDLHYPSSLEILYKVISGSTAREKIYALANEAINHPESLTNLPVKIITGLFDDELSDDGKWEVAVAWAKMPEKKLLKFLRSYAISKLFHSKNRIKYRTSIDRNMLINNLVTLNNDESYQHFYQYRWLLANEKADAFRPSHDVFGHQRGIEAISSSDIFRVAYNRSTESSWMYARSRALNDAEEVYWEKDWGSIAPRDDEGKFRVGQLAEWLWRRFVADGGKNYGPLEKAHMYALLAGGQDLGLFLDEDNPDRIYSVTEIESDPIIVEKLADAKVSLVYLDHEESDIRQSANARVGFAINFVIATPFIFIEEGA